MLNKGSIVLVVHRRLFKGDSPRFFVGRVLEYEGGVAKVYGHTWTRDIFGGKLIQKKEYRTKVFSIVSGTLIVYQLPETIELEALDFKLDRKGRVSLTANDFVMDLGEASASLGGR